MRESGKLLFATLSLFFQFHISAQDSLPDKIRISRGMRGQDVEYKKRFSNVHFKRELEFDLKDSTFLYRKKIGKSFEKLEVEPLQIFTSPGLYRKLDNLYENFGSYQYSGGKFRVFKIELIYCIHENWSIPAKAKTMFLIVADDPDNVQPEYIEALIDAYHKVIPLNWFSIY